MKILVVCQYYKPEPFRIADICQALVKQGHEVTVVTGVPNYPEGEIYPGYEKSAGTDTVDNGVRVHRCFTVPRKTGPAYRIVNYYSFAWSSTRYLARLKEEFDVVFVHQLSPVMMAKGAIRYARKWNKKVVLYCLDLWPESLRAGGIQADSLIYRVFLSISKKIYKSVDRIAVTSKGFIPYLKNFIGVEGQCVYLPQYAEDLFDGVQAYVPHEPPYHFVFAGNIGHTQSVETIVEAARLLRDDSRVIFDIVGDGAALENCRNLGRGLENVVFHGRKDVSRMPEYYAMADAMLVTMKDIDTIALTLPGKVQSYMAAGRAVLGAIGGETAAVIRDAQCGLCVPPEQPEALAQAVRQFLEEPALFERCAGRSRDYYMSQFRKEEFMERLTALLEENVN